jgi:hypothetical protein
MSLVIKNSITPECFHKIDSSYVHMKPSYLIKFQMGILNIKNFKNEKTIEIFMGEDIIGYDNTNPNNHSHIYIKQIGDKIIVINRNMTIESTYYSNVAGVDTIKYDIKTTFTYRIYNELSVLLYSKIVSGITRGLTNYIASRFNCYIGKANVMIKNNIENNIDIHLIVLNDFYDNYCYPNVNYLYNKNQTHVIEYEQKITCIDLNKGVQVIEYSSYLLLSEIDDPTEKYIVYMPVNSNKSSILCLVEPFEIGNLQIKLINNEITMTAIHEKMNIVYNGNLSIKSFWLKTKPCEVYDALREAINSIISSDNQFIYVIDNLTNIRVSIPCSKLHNSFIQMHLSSVSIDTIDD